MKRALLALAFATLIASSASADIPPGPLPEPPPPQQPMSDFERGEMIGRALGFVCGLACCFGVPAIGVVAAIVVSQRKKKQTG
ncbi:hypothetical protein [Sandaracinus amylolyticus]|uniref:hypothetical protein n=1 Tax=Sandaracinus amylolyticus TaxID=927083 RepID=UPI001F2928A9|nr:hypothetical protein [Sandaracinus amylolyticus]UJR78383.1 Hypothetical protein I5071_4100 [Sandaracinus amylolyticus]